MLIGANEFQGTTGIQRKSRREPLRRRVASVASPVVSSRTVDLLLVAVDLVEGLEVPLDDRLETRRQVAGDLRHHSASLLGRQAAPLVGVLLQLLASSTMPFPVAAHNHTVFGIRAGVVVLPGQLPG